MDEAYLEYDPNANIDTDPTSCITIIIQGCIDDLACNYDMSANVDNGSCEYVLDAQVSEFAYPDSTVTVTTDALNPTYTWYLDDVELEETSESLQPTVDGLYSVIVASTESCMVELEFELNGVGVIEVNDITFNAYPNPIADILTIEAKTTDVYNIEILNTLGEILIANDYSGDVKNNIVNIDFRHLPAGAYFLKVTTSSQTKSITLMKK